MHAGLDAPYLYCSFCLHRMQHMIAGSVAGIVEHTAMYPVDTIKTRMQALSHPGQRVRLVEWQLAVVDC